MTAPYLRSSCCGAAVVGMADVTVHPRYRTDGSAGPIIDSLKDVQDVANQTYLSPNEAYCVACGAAHDVPRVEPKEET